MEDAHKILLEKESDLARVKREIEALRIVAPLLRDWKDAMTVFAFALARRLSSGLRIFSKRSAARVRVTRPKILLVEGSDDARRAMRESLENENCDVVSSGTIAEGLSQLLAQHFNVLITDLQDTRLAGDHLMLVAGMRTFQPACVLVAVSESLTVQEAARAISLEADVIVKPSNIRQVAELPYAKTVALKFPPSPAIDRWIAKDSGRIA